MNSHEVQEAARSARAQAAAPDYDEEAIRSALWRVVDLALADEPLGIIGRERALIDQLTKRLLAAAQRHYDWRPTETTRRGSRFDVQLDIGAANPTHEFVARVTVELLPPEEPPPRPAT